MAVSEDKPKFPKIEKLELGPNDALVIRAPFRSAEDRKHFLEDLESHWIGAPKGRIIVLPECVNLTVLSQPEAKK